MFNLIRVGRSIKVSVFAQQRCDLALEFLTHLTIDIDALDREADDRAADLHSHGVVFSQAKCVLEKQDRSEFRQVVFNVETVFLTLDDGVTTRDRDVVDANFTLVAKRGACRFHCGTASRVEPLETT